MNNELEIRTLTARFFDGETSLDEERRLYELYRSATHLPDDLAPFREMMGGWESLSKGLSPRPLQTLPRPLPIREGSNYSLRAESENGGLEPRVAGRGEKKRLSTPLPHREGQGGGSSLRRLAIAASLLLLVGIATVWYASVQRQDECVAYVYGERITDREVVMQEMQLAMNAVADDDAADLVEQQLRELFSE